MKKTIKLALAGGALLISSLAYAATTTFSFSDVPSDHWAKDSITWAAKNGLMKGPDSNPGAFEPGRSANRAEIATVLHRYHTLQEINISELEKRIKALEEKIADLEEDNAATGQAGTTTANAIVDSNLTLTEALANLDPNAPAEIKDKQRLVDVHYYSFDNKIHRGQIVVDERLVNDVKAVFDVILQEKFPIQSVIPVTKYNWSDDESMKANNTSGFNYRNIAGSTTLSKHAQGFAVDVNPKINPYIAGQNSENVQPAGAVYDTSKPGTLTADSPVVKKFKELGWEWGGDWTTNSSGVPIKDYQHFEKTPQ